MKHLKRLKHLKGFDRKYEVKYERARTIRRMAAEGDSQRTIAADLDISAATVNRYLRMFTGGDDPKHDPDCPHNYFPESMNPPAADGSVNRKEQCCATPAAVVPAATAPPVLPPVSPDFYRDDDKSPGYDELRYFRDIGMKK